MKMLNKISVSQNNNWTTKIKKKSKTIAEKISNNDLMVQHVNENKKHE